MDMTSWLEDIGLRQYADQFAENAIGPDVLASLTDADLRELRIPLGHRKRLLRAIADLGRHAEGPIRRSAAPLHTQEAERRQVTVVFCDLVGSTAMSGRLDPEDLNRVMQRYQRTTCDVVHRFGGHVARFLGDGILIYFGWPNAHEDDAERSVRAGLEILGSLSTLDPGYGEHLEARIGIATGLVVVGDTTGPGGGLEGGIVGETPNLAARLQALANPGEVVIGAVTRKLVGETFRLENLGTHRLKGIVEPSPTWRVIGERVVQSRFEARGPALTAFVNRERELAVLKERWRIAAAGNGQVVVLSGEAGVGKSRIVQKLREQIGQEQHSVLHYQCSPHHTNSAFYPVIRNLEHVTQTTADDPPETRLDKLEAALGTTNQRRKQTAALFGALLLLPIEKRYPPLNMSPKRQLQETMSAVTSQVLVVAKRQPVMMIFEDAHWVDPTSLEMLSQMIEVVRKHPVLLVVTCRREFAPPWLPCDHVTFLRLNRLSKFHGAQLVTEIAGNTELSGRVLHEILAKTDGIPLFVEELTKTVLESDGLKARSTGRDLTGTAPPLAIPSTLQDSLMARLDQLASAKDIAQLGATIGREFSYRLISKVASLSEAELANALRRLVRSRIVSQRGIVPEATYVFRHALIQDSAYQSLLRTTRQQYHQRIAMALERHVPETAETNPELLAHHFSEALIADEAARYWHRAAEQAIRRSAHVEAINHVTRGVRLAQSLPDTATRRQLELDLQMTRGGALRATRGYAAPEVVDAYTKARSLCRGLPETPQLFPVLWSLTLSHFVRADVETAHHLARQLFDLGSNMQDSDMILEARIALGMTSFHLGDLQTARTHLEDGIAIYDPRKHQSHALQYGQDPGAFCLSYAAWALWFLGYPDQALQRIDEALAIARRIAHPYSRVFVLMFATRIHQCRRDHVTLEKVSREMITVAKEQGFAYYVAQGAIQRGCALTQLGNVGEGIALLHEGLSALRSTGTELGRPGSLLRLSEGYANAGLTEEAQSVLSEAMELVQQKGARIWDAEMQRLKGVYLLAVSESNQAEAEQCMMHALEIARRQQAKSLELRAAMSISRLRISEGREADARKLLSDVYAWFEEGHNTPDLEEAKAILDDCP